MEQSLWVAGDEELLSSIEGAQAETFHLHLEMWNFKIQNDLTGLSKYMTDNFQLFMAQWVGSFEI